ncbi:hypothetical protein M9H77_28220 [Catharanthus roseus]|uniref:Uncharacterized protein n=1 Tax=Catharanthus roseus TaxID=4058 RepID=A0ACC0AEP6_CATRO|nr:hypothetical protein M9H77_28220 [Catharanthus roseus]
MTTNFSFDEDLNQVIFEEKATLLKIILNRPQNMNCLTHEMIYQMKRALEACEYNTEIKLVVIKGIGKAFSAGGDVIRVVQCVLAGHWTFVTKFYMKQLLLDFLLATYAKPIVFFINGVVMGGGAGLSMNGRIRVVTEKTVFAMPEVLIGHYPDVGVSYFLSKLPGHFGEYLGLTGRQLDGAEMLACGLATHFVLSKDIEELENKLEKLDNNDNDTILNIIKNFAHTPTLKEDSPYKRLDLINKCFSKKTVEEILLSLEHEGRNNEDKWIQNAVRSIKLASPTSLKLCLKTIRDAWDKTYKDCLVRDLIIGAHIVRRTVNSDFFEGARATFFDKDRKPKWNPPSLEQVNDEMMERYFIDHNHEDWDHVLKMKHYLSNLRMKTSKL